MFCETERDAILQDAKSWIASYLATGGNATEEPASDVTSDTPPPAAKKRALSDFELEWENHVTQGNDTAVDEVHIYLNLTPSKEYKICWVGGVNMTRPFLCCQDSPVRC